MILLQVDATFNDEFEIVYKGFYKTENTFIFAWSSIPSVGNYHWLRSLIHQLLPNNKVNKLFNLHHLTHLRFPAVMNYHYGIT
jgi:hypothetical protein